MLIEPYKCIVCLNYFMPTESAYRRRKCRPIRYCSAVCKFAGQNKQLRPMMTLGPCPTCKETFKSKALKKYCSMRCYVTSEEFKEIIKKANNIAEIKSSLAAGNIPGRVDVFCLNCNKKFQNKPSDPDKYCSTHCYRSYQASRFDRYVSNPEAIALPQNYDEFMLKDELPCLFSDCNWHGKFLGAHVNLAHGISARDFKIISGFNLKTGLVTSDLSSIMRDSAISRGEKNLVFGKRTEEQKSISKEKYNNYKSLESKEHHLKSVSMRQIDYKNIIGECRFCKSAFNYTANTFGKNRLYCSIKCRSKFYN